MARAVRWDLIADSRKYQRGFREAEQTTKHFHGMVTKTASLIGGAFAAIQVGSFLKDSIAEGREAAKVGKQTAAVIKSTGGVAKVTAGQVSDLAESISAVVGVDDELIQSGENWLLTFKKVRNEAGKGNDIFDRATQAAVDMAAAMHEGEVTASGLHSANTMLGKALNDPLKGMTALAKAGVTFTKQQQDQIKTLVASGDTLKAQKIILGEVESQVKGFAAASADPWDKMTVAFANVKEKIGTVLLPAFNSAATFITGTLIPAAEKWWQDHGPAVRDAFNGIHQAAKSFWEGLQANLIPQLDRVKQAWDDNKEAILGLIGVLDDNHDATQEGADAAKAFGDALVGITTFAGDASTFLDNLGTVINTVNGAFQTAAKAIHDHFTVPVIEDLRQIGIVFITSWEKMLGVLATVAETLHLPFADGLRQAQQAVTGFKDDFNTAMDNLKNEDVSIDVKGVWVPSASLKSTLAAQGALKSMGFARGGAISGAGTATSDSVPAWLSTGEHVWSAREVQGAGGHRAVEAMRRQARGFAAGGAITPDLNLPSVARLGAGASRVIGQLASMLDRLTIRVPMRGNPDILSFIRSVDPLPYVWGAVGPGAYDCSGLVGEVLNRHLGLPSYQRRFTTSSIGAGQYGLQGGLGGVLDIGVTAGTGHMAGSYMGMGFEAEGSRTGIKIGGAASPPSSFARRFHLAQGGAVEREMLAAYANLAGVSIGGDPGALRVNGFGTFDRGGWLRPGLTMAMNATGRSEPVGIDYTKLGKAVANALAANPPAVYLDRQKVTRAVRDGVVWDARGR
jgi:hypothetical protein